MNFKTILILGLITLLSAGLVFTLLRRPKIHPVGSTTLTPTKVLDRKVKFPASTKDAAKVVFYSEEDQPGLYRVDVSSGKTELFRPFKRIDSVSWSPDRKKALLSVLYREQEFRAERSRFLSDSAFDGAFTLWAYDMETDRLAQLPVGASSVVWDPAGQKIYYHYFDLTTEKVISELVVRDPFSGSRTKLADIPESASYTIEFIDADTLFLVPNLTDPSGSTTAYLFDLKTNKIQELVSEKVVQAHASLGGSFVLYQPAGGSVWHLFNVKTGQDKNLKASADEGFITWISDEDFLIVEPEESASDRLTLADAQTLTSLELLLAPLSIFHFEDIIPTGTKTLYFTSDNILYRLDLP